MSRHEALSDWTRELSSHMSHLSKPQAAVLAMWSYGIAVTRTCSCYTVAMFLAILLKRKMNTVRQQLREWCYDGADKRGTRRQQLDVEASFAPLLRWVVHVWVGTTMALAMDATSLGDRFVVLSISVVYRGMGIPVAWTVLTAQRKGAWREHWLRILEQVRPALPAEWTVLVLADRGMYARWLYRRIVRLGWHPFLRINRWTAALVLADGVAVSSWHLLARRRHRVLLQRPPSTLHLGRLVGRRARGGLVHHHRLAQRGLPSHLVCTARLVRARLQMHQAGRLAVAAHAHERSRPRHSSVAGLGRGDAVDGQSGQRPRSRPQS
jgi:hypothetical protein